MIYFASFIISMVLTMLLVPLVKNLAYRFDFVDAPNSRKVHIQPMPRIGGLAIILGALVPLLFWLPLDQTVIAYSVGALLIIVLALLDDKYDLSPLLKLVVQSAAALIAVVFGDLGVHQFHLFWEFSLSSYASIPITVIFILTVINAVNFSDGLDGLAGGITLLSLTALMMLAYRTGAADIVLICIVLIGGVLGFLLFNSHPAQIFMGEVGSQFIGYSLAVLTIYLTQSKTTVYSAFLPLLLIGLPLVDLVIVVLWRLARKKSPFVADKGHIHHRLLDIGLKQYGAVFILYLLQCVAIGAALIFRFEGDAFVLFLFLILTLVTGGMLFLCWKLPAVPGLKYINALIDGPVRQFNTYVERLDLAKWSRLLAVLAIIGYLLAGVMEVEKVGLIESGIAAALFIMLIAFHPAHFAGKLPGWFIRFVFYLSASGIMLYVYSESPGIINYKPVMDAFFIMLSLLIFFGINFSGDSRMTLRPVDFLVIITALILPVISTEGYEEKIDWVVAIHLLVLFYGIELVLLSYQGDWKMKYIQYLYAVPPGVLAIRGVMSI